VLQVRGVRRALRAMRSGLVIGAGGALHGARIVCDAMRCARAGCIRAQRCDARDAQADALLRCMGADCLRCNALHARWLHWRGAGGAMLLTEGFLGWEERV
jgi:hypothetical protein